MTCDWRFELHKRLCSQSSRSDLSGGWYFLHFSKTLTPPVGLRPPEFVFTGAVNENFDIRNFGCLVFDLVTGQPLFCVAWYLSESERDDDHLLAFTAGLISPLPENLYKH
ncbi:hypothetical protein FHL15_009438 [Xylaria flabelliformis]|uniref:Protein kinase domain-containing protein n=1 Tax=Xylaria flabelliformis TaxID=2512241 RepID=A0A553HNZ8_9PEZI|nr:hypothetical protein FHL15_009438 [Xylaria flabelliformis]